MTEWLLVELVKSHYMGDAAFHQALLALIADLEKTGQRSLVSDLKKVSKLDDINTYSVSSAATLPMGLPPDTLAPKRPNPLSGKRSHSGQPRNEPGPIGSIQDGGMSRGSSVRRQGAPMSSKSVAGQQIPKDRDSSLDLYEILYPTVGLADLILPPKQCAALRQVINEAQHAQRLASEGLQPTQRVLFCGPPGCGKTTAAKAIAHELGLPMAYVRLDSLVSSYLGQTSTNIRRIFDSLGSDPIVLFLDEVDAIAKKRDDSQEIGELKRVVITLLQNFDNVGPNVFILAATNHAHLLDPAIWRRFDLTVQLDLPGKAERKEMIEMALGKSTSNLEIQSGAVKASKGEATKGLDVEKLARLTAGLSGSQIQTIINQVRRQHIIGGAERITTEAIMEAIVGFHTRMSESGNDAILVLVKHLRDEAVPWRDIEKAVGVPQATLRDRFDKWSNERNGDQ